MPNIGLSFSDRSEFLVFAVVGDWTSERAWLQAGPGPQVLVTYHQPLGGNFVVKVKHRKRIPLM